MSGSLMGLKQHALMLERHRLRGDQVPVIRAALLPLLEREVRAARGALGELDSWMEGFYEEQQAEIRSAVSPVMLAYASTVVGLTLEEAGSSVTPAGLDLFGERFSEGLAARWTNDSIAQLRQIMRDEEEPVEVVKERLDAWEEGRAERTAEAEATQGGGAFARFAMLIAGVDEMVWRTVGESCPLCRKMDGRRVQVSAAFLEAGSVLEEEGESGTLRAPRRIAHPPLHGSGKMGGVCDCMVSPA